jgi:hypothetical protein|tara:strand:+ start:602 stop:817 length:216 start_codon:yes stop_codon:yes gene_type:complete
MKKEHRLRKVLLNIKEPGCAEMHISLSQGVITIKHGTDKEILSQWVASKGDWSKIWKTFDALRLNEVNKIT